MRKILFLALAAMVSVRSFAAGTDSKLYFDETTFQKHLDGMTETGASQEDHFELALWQDGLGVKRVAQDTPVEISVTVYVPKTGDALGDPLELVRAKGGCVVEYKGGNLSITLTRPNVFVDPRPGSSSATWRYGISADLKKTGAAYAVAKGVLVRKDKACISLFGLKSKKDGEAWSPGQKSEYTYKIEIRPDEWKSLGELDDQSAFKKSGDGMARFIWAPGTENKSVEFRWIIEGKYTQTEATEWTRMQNPCCSDAPPAAPKVQAALSEIKPPTETKPPIQTPPPAASAKKGPYPTFTVHSSAGAERTNVRSEPKLADNVAWQADEGFRVKQIGPGVTDAQNRVWIPIRFIDRDKKNWDGYIRDLLLTDPKFE